MRRPVPRLVSGRGVPRATPPQFSSHLRGCVPGAQRRFVRTCAVPRAPAGDGLKVVNWVAGLAWEDVFGLGNADSTTKQIPDLGFNVSEDLRVAFLRGYLLGDGTVCKNRIAFSTSSYDIASGIVYALSSFGVIPSMSEREPDGVIR